MNNTCNKIIFIVILQIIYIINDNNKVYGKSLGIDGLGRNDDTNEYGNQQRINGLASIYSGDSWNNNDELEYQPRNKWMNNGNKNNNQKDSSGDCRNGCVGGETSVIDAPVKKEVFISRGWGAGGMPFNILYMKNPKSSRIPRPPNTSSSTSIIAEPLRSQPPYESQYMSPQVSEESPNIVGTIGEIIPRSIPNNNNNNNRPRGRSSNTVFVPSRRHYSIIPQLFVSYGWGPIGK